MSKKEEEHLRLVKGMLLDCGLKGGEELKKYGPKKYLEKLLSDPMTDCFKVLLSEYYDELKTLGICPDIYADTFVKYYAKDYITDLRNLPRIITADNIIEHVPMKTILDELNYCSFGEFLQQFDDAEGSFGLLVEKFIDEIGYSSDYNEFEALADIIMYNGSDGINLKKFADAINVSFLDDYERRGFYELLEKNGLDSGTLQKFL